jgi:hypothetical protein
LYEIQATVILIAPFEDYSVVLLKMDFPFFQVVPAERVFRKVYISADVDGIVQTYYGPDGTDQESIQHDFDQALQTPVTVCWTGNVNAGQTLNLSLYQPDITQLDYTFYANFPATTYLLTQSTCTISQVN